MTTNVFKFSLLTAVVIVAIVGAAWYLLDAPEGEPAAFGRIEGDTSYPSEGTPAQIVCAEPVDGGSEYCEETRGTLTDGASATTWSIEVPAGIYYVSAHLKDPAELGSDLGDYRAYYSQFVVCGMAYECSDHTKIAVTVGSGETVRDVQPYDWYAR